MGTNVKFPGLQRRIFDRLRHLEYWKNGRPDVSRFAIEKGYLPSFLYNWLKGSTPSFENLVKLSADLDVDLPWLLLGEEHFPVPAAPAASGLKTSGQLHAKARRVGKVRARGLRGPLPLVADLDGIASYQTLRRARKGLGREISGGALLLVSPSPVARRAA